MRKGSGATSSMWPRDSEQLFEEVTVDLMMEGGDADTNTAVACALLCAYVGYAKLPSHWKLGLAHKDWLLFKSLRLAVVSGAISGTMQPEADKAADGRRARMTRIELKERFANVIAQNKKRAKDAKQRERADEKGGVKERNNSDGEHGDVKKWFAS